MILLRTTTTTLLLLVAQSFAHEGDAPSQPQTAAILTPNQQPIISAAQNASNQGGAGYQSPPQGSWHPPPPQGDGYPPHEAMFGDYDIPPGYVPVGHHHPEDLSEEEYKIFVENQDSMMHPGPRSNETESLAAEWERIMTDYLPDMIITFRLAATKQEHFHQDVGALPVLIRGGFFESSEDGSAPISFQILSPSGKTVYKRTRGEGLFRFETKEPGTYTFAVMNHGWTGHKYVTFVVGAGQEKPLSHEDLKTLDGNIKGLYRMLTDMEAHSSYLWTRQKSNLEAINRTASQTYYALICQLLISSLVTVVQLNVIKRMVTYRRMF